MICQIQIIINNNNLMYMKFCKKCQKFKELNEFRTRKDRPCGFSSQCKKCKNIAALGWQRDNPEKMKIQRFKYVNANPEKVKIATNNWKEANLEQYKSAQLAWKVANPEKVKDSNRRYYQKNYDKVRAKAKIYVNNNRAKINALVMKRHAAKLKRTPKWLTKQQLKEIEKFYILSHKLTEETGIRYEVDHLIPLQGKDVSGLHVPWNLRVLIGPGPWGNSAKGNRFY